MFPRFVSLLVDTACFNSWSSQTNIKSDCWFLLFSSSSENLTVCVLFWCLERLLSSDIYYPHNFIVLPWRGIFKCSELARESHKSTNGHNISFGSLNKNSFTKERTLRVQWGWPENMFLATVHSQWLYDWPPPLLFIFGLLFCNTLTTGWLSGNLLQHPTTHFSFSFLRALPIFKNLFTYMQTHSYKTVFVFSRYILFSACVMELIV